VSKRQGVGARVMNQLANRVVVRATGGRSGFAAGRVQAALATAVGEPAPATPIRCYLDADATLPQIRPAVWGALADELRAYWTAKERRPPR